MVANSYSDTLKNVKQIETVYSAIYRRKPDIRSIVVYDGFSKWFMFMTRPILNSTNKFQKVDWNVESISNISN